MVRSVPSRKSFGMYSGQCECGGTLAYSGNGELFQKIVACWAAWRE